MSEAGTEAALTFDCEGETLVGILHRPAGNAPPAHAALGVVVIVGGPQYRAGSHRQFVQLARSLAEAGHPVLRFDVRGMGDSSGALRHFEQITPDIGAAIDALQRHAPEVRRVALWGLCDGASAALLYLDELADRRVSALCLFNPWVRSEASLARTHAKHYYAQRLRQRQFWVKLLSGRVAASALRELVVNLRLARRPGPANATMEARPYQARMADGWRAFGGGVLLALSGADFTAREFEEYTAASSVWQPLLHRDGVLRRDLTGVDHTFSSEADKHRVNVLTSDWLRSQVGRGTAIGTDASTRTKSEIRPR